jgi:hypothetical protein
MTTIRTTCRHCGDVELTPLDLTLELEPQGDTGQYRFSCPFCDFIQRRPANGRVVSILLAAGVVYEVTAYGGPITEEEIASFRCALDRVDWYSEIHS